MSRPAAGGAIKAARALRAMPATAAAHRAGSLGVAKVRLLADARASAPELFDEHEAMLVASIADLRVEEAAKVLSFWRKRANPDGSAAAAEKRRASRGLDLSQTFDGVWFLQGQLTPEQGEALRNQLDPIVRRLRAADQAALSAGDLDAVRTPRQLRVDALSLLVLQGSSAGADGNPINTPSVTFIVDLTDLATAAPGAPVGETEHGEAVSAEAARRHTCDAACARVVFGPDSTPTDLGRTARLPSPAQRRALAARDRGCTFPGCDLPPGWTNAHHLVHWIHGGPTDLANLALLCVHHHHRVHEGGLTVTRQADGTLEFRRPDGTLLTVPKQRAPNRHPPPKAA
jgi:hypothetical protein